MIHTYIGRNRLIFYIMNASHQCDSCTNQTGEVYARFFCINGKNTFLKRNTSVYKRSNILLCTGASCTVQQAANEFNPNSADFVISPFQLLGNVTLAFQCNFPSNFHSFFVLTIVDDAMSGSCVDVIICVQI